MVRVLIGVALVFLMIVLGVQFLPDMLTSTDQVLTDEDTIEANITTGGAETTGTVQLTNALYESDTSHVTSITSTHGGDSAAPSSYAASTKILTVSGLAASQTRTLTVVHEYDALSEYTAAAPATKMGPTLFLLVLFIGIPAAMILAAFGIGSVRG